MQRKYHKTLGFPQDVKLPTCSVLLEPSIHALQRAKDWQITLPKFVDCTRHEIFELVTENHAGREIPIKLGIRIPYSTSVDVCIVVEIRRSAWGIVTIWLNHQDDEHITLNSREYDVPT